MTPLKIYEKELNALLKKENKMRIAAAEAAPPTWKAALKEKIPEKAMTALEIGFREAFRVVFSHGNTVIERTFNRREMEQDRKVRQYAVELKRTRKELKKFCAGASDNALNTVITTAEGVGLGLLGVGIPDIAIFLGVLLRGIYETAIGYGFEYDTPEERIFILRMIEAALSNGDDYESLESSVNRMIYREVYPKISESEQIERTAKAMSVDMLLLKFIQGLPIAGIIGGIGNPIVYNKVMSYVRIKYKKRYLMGEIRKIK